MELLNNSVFIQDMFHFFCGAVIGEGQDRIVYEYLIDPGVVVKIDKGDSFANVAEWHIWQNISRYNKDASVFFAPCINISPCGKLMLQKRTEPLTELPKLIPSFIWDIKKDNWGMIGQQPVCHDYANHIMSKKVNSKLVKPKWYE